jgi:hydrogenase expression/formation protein HypD
MSSKHNAPQVRDQPRSEGVHAEPNRERARSARPRRSRATSREGARTKAVSRPAGAPAVEGGHELAGRCAEHLRSREVTRKLVARIETLSDAIPRDGIRIMHVCGTHEDTVSRYGIRSLLPAKVEIIPGPGCPVCVTTMREIDEALSLTQKAVVTTFGDLLKVPGSEGRSLADAKAAGGDVRVVYSIFDALKIAAGTGAEVVHVAVGFETTAPSTASALREKPPENFSILTCHRLVPPAMDVLLQDREARIDGLIDPGHVSAVIGLRPYEALSRRYAVPQVVAGFEPNDLLLALVMLLEMIREGKGEVRNEYARVVRREGNVKALGLLEEVFEPCDVAWRGFPVLPGSGLRLREPYAGREAREKFALEVRSAAEDAGECICGMVLRGRAYPDDCKLFGKACTPERPVGACMVSSEGSCGIWYRYGKF